MTDEEIQAAAERIAAGLTTGMVADLEWTICTCPCTCGGRK